MQGLQLSQATPEYMDSREIAEQTGKEHHNVLRDIEKMLLDLDEGDALRFESVYVGGNGEKRKCYHLPKIDVVRRKESNRIKNIRRMI